MAEPQGLGKKYTTRTITEEIEWPLQQMMWELIASLAKNQQIKELDYLQIFELQPLNRNKSGYNQQIIHRQEQPPYERTYHAKMSNPVKAKIYVHIDFEADTATMMFPNEW